MYRPVGRDGSRPRNHLVELVRHGRQRRPGARRRPADRAQRRRNRCIHRIVQRLDDDDGRVALDALLRLAAHLEAVRLAVAPFAAVVPRETVVPLVLDGEHLAGCFGRQSRQLYRRIMDS